jgi:hypothetical protein
LAAANAILAAKFKDEMDELKVSDSDQIRTLIKQGFTVDAIVSAGYTKADLLESGITQDQYDTAQEAQSSLGKPASAVGSSTSSSGFPIIIVVVALIVLLVIVGAVVYVKNQSSGGAGSGSAAVSFENPMYDSVTKGTTNPTYGEAAYMDLPAGNAASDGTSSYVSISPDPPLVSLCMGRSFYAPLLPSVG